MNNIIFIVTSVVNVKNLSVYTPEERYSQTKITIQSIKRFVPNAKIIVLETSKNISFDDVTMMYFEPPDGFYYNKSVGEASYLKMFLSSTNFPPDTFFFKISGRYFLNEKFKLELFDKNEINAREVIQSNGKCCVTSLFGFPSSKIELIMERLNNVIMYGYIEHNLLKGISFNNISFLGISGYISPTGLFINY